MVSDKVTMDEKSLQPGVAYICDRRACEACHPLCVHTTDIHHAVNFREFADGKWMEVHHEIECVESALVDDRK